MRRLVAHRPAVPRSPRGRSAWKSRGRALGRALGRRWRPLTGLVLAAAFLYLLFWRVIPFHLLTIAPGPAPDVATLVTPWENGTAAGPEEDRASVEPRDGGAGPEPGEGRFLLTTVRASPATPLELWRALTDPSVDLVPRAWFVPAGMSDEAYEDWGLAAMAESQATAAWQAWTFLGHETSLVSDGARVFFVAPASPARDQVQVGDVVVSWSLAGRGGPVVTADDFERNVSEAFTTSAGSGGSVTMTLEIAREGLLRTAIFPVTEADLAEWPFLGLALGAERPRTDPPVPVSFLPGDIGGPSGGLMLALEIIDDFEPGDLTSGKVIAGSGTLGAGGLVGPVGGIAMKIEGAAATGATVFLVPDQDYGEAQLALSGPGLEGLQLIPVSSLIEAHQALVSLTGKKTADYNRADLPPEEPEQAVLRAVGR